MGHEHHTHLPRNNYGKFIAVILSFCLLAVLGYALQHTISCFLLSWVIAYLLDPLLIRAEQYGLKRPLALCLLYVILTLLMIFFLTFIVPAITINWNFFIQELPIYIQKLKMLAVEWRERIPERHRTDEINWLIEKLIGKADKAVEKAGNWFYGFGTSFFFNVFNIVLAPILVFFMLYYKHTVKETLTSWIPPHFRKLTLDIGEEVNRSIGGYLRGQVVVSIIVAIMVTTALLLTEIPHPFFCGVFAGAASVLPFIGVLLATLPALFFTWAKFQTVNMLTQTCLVFALIYFIEGYIIKPLIFKESMNLNPLVTIIMVMALGETLGFWGILLALPIASAIKITWGHFLNGDFKHH